MTGDTFVPFGDRKCSGISLAKRPQTPYKPYGEGLGMSNEILQADLGKAAEERYLNYALSVITSRALPDARDGLKPVQRRILYAMFQNLRLVASAKARKSAQIVGEVIGKYHPHGDSAAYEAMVRMAQSFSLRYPLVHGEGNFGSLDGDSAAAYRYTEARLTAIAEEILTDLGSETVDWRTNYDSTLEEPIVLPSRLPQLLMNGSTGIAVGMATNIPPHNLTEVCAALTALIDNKKLAVKDLLKHIRGPDFPTGGELLSGRSELRAAYESGQGTLRLRGEYKVEPLSRGKRQIVITSIPYTVNKATLVEKLGGLILDRKLPQIVDVRDESTNEVRIILELKADAEPEVAMAFLFKHTDLQINFGVNLTCLTPAESPAGATPKRISLLDICREFLDFRMTIVTRRLEFEKRKLEARLHILDGFHKIHLDLDKAIRIIRRAEGRADAAKKLQTAFKLDEVQTDAILELRLYQLARLELDKLESERKEKKKRLAEVDRLLRRPSARWKIIRGELAEISEKYGDDRRTKVTVQGREDLSYDPSAYIVQEEATVLLTQDGWLRRVRELKDPSTARLREGDALVSILPGTTRDRLVLLSSRGVAYVTAVSEVPATTGYGDPVQSLFKFADGERVVRSFLLPEASEPAPAEPEPKKKGKSKKGQGDLFDGEVIELLEPARQLLVASASGYGFRTTPDLLPTSRSGRRFARVPTGDELVSITDSEESVIFCLARSGKGVRFSTSEVTELSGVGRGVILMRLDAKDRMLGAVAADKTAQLEIGIAGGSPRKVASDAFPQSKRGAKGSKVVKRGTPESIKLPS